MYVSQIQQSVQITNFILFCKRNYIGTRNQIFIKVDIV